MEQLLNEEFFSEINYPRVFIGTILLLLHIFIINFFYSKYSRSRENKNEFKKVLPLFGLSIFLIISVIKTSLALSLGLVGALSIIRFRTAIKEPEQIVNFLVVMALAISIAAEKEILSIIIIGFYLSVYKFNSNLNSFENEIKIYRLKVLKSDKLDFNVNDLFRINKKVKIISYSINLDNDHVIEFLCEDLIDLEIIKSNFSQYDTVVEIL